MPGVETKYADRDSVLSQALAALNTVDVGSFTVTFEVLRAIFRFLSPSTSEESQRITSDSQYVTKKTLDALARHWNNLEMQVVTSAVLFYTTLDSFMDQQQDTRARALTTIINAMRDNFDNLQLVKNCCLTLRNFQRDDELVGSIDTICLPLALFRMSPIF